MIVLEFKRKNAFFLCKYTYNYISNAYIKNVMNFNQLLYAVNVWKKASFSKAGLKFNISQSAISQQISKLEDELGFLIFDRLRQNLSPTKNGLIFLQEAQQLLLSFNRLQDFGKNLNLDHKGKLNVGIIPTLSSYLVALFFEEFNRNYPKIDLSIFEMRTESIMNGLLDRSLDTGIIATPIKTRLKFESKTLFYEKFFVYSAIEYPFYDQKSVVLDPSCYNDMWVLQEGNCFSDQIVNICQLGNDFKQNLSYSCDSIEALRRIVDQRNGFTFIPELATITISADDENKIKNISGPEFVREISMIYLKKRT